MQRGLLSEAKVFEATPASDRPMARRKRKEDEPDWVAPDFDEVGYMRRELEGARAAVATIGWAVIGASWRLPSIRSSRSSHSSRESPWAPGCISCSRSL